jgi:hypothetical protein
MFVALPRDLRWGRSMTSAGRRPPGKGGAAAMEEATTAGAADNRP